MHLRFMGQHDKNQCYTSQKLIMSPMILVMSLIKGLWAHKWNLVKFSLLRAWFWLSNKVTNLHMSRQLSCRDMCKIVTCSDHCVSNNSNFCNLCNMRNVFSRWLRPCPCSHRKRERENRKTGKIGTCSQGNIRIAVENTSVRLWSCSYICIWTKPPCVQTHFWFSFSYVFTKNVNGI